MVDPPEFALDDSRLGGDEVAETVRAVVVAALSLAPATRRGYNSLMGTIIDSLTAEHALLCELFDEIDRLLPDLRTLPEVRLLSRLVEGVLSRHADVETHLAFAALDHAQAENGQLTRLHQDHQEIGSHLRRAKLVKAFPQAVRLLKAGLAASRKHFRREEQTVFPLFERLLDAANLAALGSAAPRTVSSLGPHGFANALRGQLRNSTHRLSRKHD